MSQRRLGVILSDGTVVYDIVGADPGSEEDDDEELDDGGDDDGEDPDGDDDDSEDDAGSSGRKTRKQLEEEVTTLSGERDRALRRMRNADKAKARAEKERDALKNGGQSELAAAQAKVHDLETQLAAAQGQDAASLVREEFRDLDDYDWQNRKIAFGLLDLSEVDVEDGKVDIDSLKDAVKKLAAEHPYLVKPKPAASDGDDDEDDAPPPPSAGVHGNRKQKNSLKNQEALVGKYHMAGRF